MNLYYANEQGKGLVLIAGNAGQVSRCVDSCAYRETEEALAQEVAEAVKEFGITSAPIRYATIAELEAAYSKPLD